MRSLIQVAAVSAWALAPVCLAGPAVDEPPGGAGNRLSTAFAPIGVGSIQQIHGNLTGSFGRGVDHPDYEDAFLVNISDPSAFSAQTYSALTPNPLGRSLTGFDTTLWLFDMGEHALLANQDRPGGDRSSFLPNAADDGSGQTVPGPGCYMIVVSISGRMPLSAAALPMFSFGSLTEVSGPDGPGGGSPLETWEGLPGAGGEYFIYLSGVEFCPAPGPGAALGMAGLALASRRRR